MTKEQMVRSIENMDDAVHRELFEGLNATSDLLKALQTVASTASTRFLAASASVAQFRNAGEPPDSSARSA